MFLIRNDCFPTFFANAVEIAALSSSVNARVEYTFASAMPVHHSQMP